MKRFLKDLLTKTVLRPEKNEPEHKTEYTTYELAKAYWELRVSAIAWAEDIALIALGIGSAGFGLKVFLFLINLSMAALQVLPC